MIKKFKRLVKLEIDGVQEEINAILKKRACLCVGSLGYESATVHIRWRELKIALLNALPESNLTLILFKFHQLVRYLLMRMIS